MLFAVASLLVFTFEPKTLKTTIHLEDICGKNGLTNRRNYLMAPTQVADALLTDLLTYLLLF